MLLSIELLTSLTLTLTLTESRGFLYHMIYNPMIGIIATIRSQLEYQRKVIKRFFELRENEHQEQFIDVERRVILPGE